ncbi:hypothetical protein [Streptomyces composti]|uniref:hypothetical protein n=1 Tax=Streptomyces composti TaxID=2720025 RepID=UPI0019D3050B|nr:hypothetical protein [Streptomyces composti]
MTFSGTGERDSVSRSRRVNLPDSVVAGHEYRDIEVIYRLATRLTDELPGRPPSGQRA